MLQSRRVTRYFVLLDIFIYKKETIDIVIDKAVLCLPFDHKGRKEPNKNENHIILSQIREHEGRDLLMSYFLENETEHIRAG